MGCTPSPPRCWCPTPSTASARAASTRTSAATSKASWRPEATMTALHLADGSGLADLAGYLVRLLRYDRAAVVHLRADGPVLGTFGRLPFGGGTSGVIALRTTELAVPARLDAAVSAG